MELIDIMRGRRSVRRYTDEPLTDEQLKKILSAALLAPSGHAHYPCEFIVVRNRELLDKMSHCRKFNIAKMLSGAAAAVVVIADRDKSETIIEDSSVAMMNMELMASSMGIGNCWIQVRGREAEDGRLSARAVELPRKFCVSSGAVVGHSCQRAACP